MSLLGLCLLSGLDSPPARADFTFGEPVNLKTLIPFIDPVHECIDCFSSDGLEMYITSNRPGGSGDWDLWVLRRSSTDADWGPPENLGPNVNTSADDSVACISPDGLTLYWDSKRPGGFGYYDIYLSTRETKDDPWGPAVNLGPTINSSATDASAWVSPDNLELYFASYRTGGYGSADIYVAKRARATDLWGDAKNLGPTVNSPYTEQYVSLSTDGLLMFFCEPLGEPLRPGGYGGPDMWMARRANLSAPWQTPVNLGPVINAATNDFLPRMSPDGCTFHFMSGVSGDWSSYDNWAVPIIPVCDFNGDGQADGKDVLCLASHWGTDDPMCDIGPFAWGDGTVDLQDLIVLAEYLGKEVIDPALIAHWALDESEGSTANDSVSGEDAFVMGEPVWQPDGGMVGGALELDGIDDCVITSTGPNPAEGLFSIVAWIKCGTPGQVIISQPNGSDWLAVDDEGKLMTELNGSGKSAAPLLSQEIITDEQWHHIGLVWDGSRRMLGVDGVIVAEDTQEGAEIFGSGLYIGVGKDYTTGTYFSGLIDDVRIYNRVVSP